MKIFDLFLKVFSVFAFLTIGSLLLMVSLRIVGLEDIIRDISSIYSEPFLSAQTFFVGLFFVVLGLAFAKILIKQTRYAGGIVYTGPQGRTTVSVFAIEDIVRKVLKKKPEINDFSLKCRGYEKKAEIKIRLKLQADVQVPQFSDAIQTDIRTRLKKILDLEEEIEIYIEIQQMEEKQKQENLDTVRIGKAL